MKEKHNSVFQQAKLALAEYREGNFKDIESILACVDIFGKKAIDKMGITEGEFIKIEHKANVLKAQNLIKEWRENNYSSYGVILLDLTWLLRNEVSFEEIGMSENELAELKKRGISKSERLSFLGRVEDMFLKIVGKLRSFYCRSPLK